LNFLSLLAPTVLLGIIATIMKLFYDFMVKTVTDRLDRLEKAVDEHSKLLGNRISGVKGSFTKLQNELTGQKDAKKKL
jgi:hypothetical protein